MIIDSSIGDRLAVDVAIKSFEKLPNFLPRLGRSLIPEAGEHPGAMVPRTVRVPSHFGISDERGILFQA
jgi:hypothetical protein